MKSLIGKYDSKNSRYPPLISVGFNENPVYMLAEAGLNFALNLYIRNTLLRPTEDKGVTEFGFSDSPKNTGTPKIGR